MCTWCNATACNLEAWAQRTSWLATYFATGNASAAAWNENVASQTAQHIIQHFRQTGSTSNKLQTGWSSMLTNYNKQQIIQTAWKNHCTPLTEIKNLISAKISVSTVWYVLAAEGHHQWVAQRVSFLTPHHKHLRWLWGTMDKQWTHQSWRQVIFSNKSSRKLTIQCLDMYSWTWR